MKTHFVVRPAGVVGNHVKFVGLHAVMLCKGFNFVATHVFCYFLPKMGDAGGKTWQNNLKKMHNHVKGTNTWLSLSLFLLDCHRTFPKHVPD